jgi:hypothetical protein
MVIVFMRRGEETTGADTEGENTPFATSPASFAPQHCSAFATIAHVELRAEATALAALDVTVTTVWTTLPDASLTMTVSVPELPPGT